MLFANIISDIYATRSLINNDKNLTNENRKEMGYQLKDMLISCFFNYEPCTVNDFTYFHDPLYGNCYTFNKGINDNGTKTDIKIVSLAGT